MATATPEGNVAALFMGREEKLNKEQKEYLGKLCASDEAMSDARGLDAGVREDGSRFGR